MYPSNSAPSYPVIRSAEIQTTSPVVRGARGPLFYAFYSEASHLRASLKGPRVPSRGSSTCCGAGWICRMAPAGVYIMQGLSGGGYADFLELRVCELRRIPLPRTSVNNGTERAGVWTPWPF